MPRREVAGQPSLRQGGGDAKAVNAVAHGVAVAVPVADHHRQTGSHCLDRRDAERLLDVVGEAAEHISRGPCSGALSGLAAVECDHPHARAELCSGLSERLGNVLVGMPAALHQHDILAGLERLRGLLQRLIHRQRMRLGVKRQPTHEQDDVGLFTGAQLLACGGAGLGIEYEVAGVDAQRDHRQLRQHQSLHAQALHQMVHLRLEDALDIGLDRGAGADHGIPRLHWCRHPFGDGVHGTVGAGGVGDPAQTPARVPKQRAVPRVFTNSGAGVVDAAGLRQRPQLGAGQCVDR